MPENGSTRKMGSKLFQTVKFILVAAIVFYVVWKSGGVRMLETMADARLGWVVLSAACFFLSVALGAFQWSLLMRFQGIFYSYIKCYKIYHLGLFTHALVFNLAGDALRVYKLKTGNTDITTGFMVTFMDRFVGLFVLSLFALIAASGIWLRGQLNENTIRAVFFACLCVFLVFALGVLSLASRRM
jgi:hypothetical protein